MPNIPQQAIMNALKRFGHEEFRQGQLQAIEILLEDSDSNLLFVAPTGGGKSLVYQLTALLLPGTSLVISPLIALMEDQVVSLTEKGIPATLLASTIDQNENRNRIADIDSGKYKIVYVAPERLAQSSLQKLIRKLNCPLIAVDEAHCISQWGHDFRPEYLNLKNFLASLNETRVIACTATATPAVRDEIIQNLGLSKDTPQHVYGFARPNLSFTVENVKNAARKHKFIDALLKRNLRSTKSSGTAIIYTVTRKDTQIECKRLLKKGWNVATYHAGMDHKSRNKVGHGFAKGKLEVVVATNAFGMGIDRSDVRVVIHMGPPDSIESYYQEAGRAGRDGKESDCLLFISPGDMAKRKYLISKGDSGSHKDHKWELYLELMRWSEGVSCRHDSILKYFGDEKEVLQGCGKCDVCLQIKSNPDWTTEETTEIALKILSGISRADNMIGMKRMVKLLRGEDDRSPNYRKLKATRSWGILKEYDSDWISQTIQRFASAGWIDFTTGEYALLILTPTGRNVLFGLSPAKILLPPLYSENQRKKDNKPKNTTEKPDVAKNDDDLFNSLRDLRIQIANRENVPAYIVFNDKTLSELAEVRPDNLAELQSIYGIGPQKAEKYGPEILKCIQSFSSESANITVDSENQRKKDNKPKNTTEKPDVAKNDDDLFNSLRDLGIQIANRENVPAYIVFNDKTLRKLSKIRPKNLAELEFYEIGPFYQETKLEVLALINKN